MIKATLRELVEQNPILNNDEFSLESALTNSFHQLTSLYIDPVWHQLTQTSHRLLADVAGLRRILFQLIDNDAVGFLDELEELRQTELSALRTGKPVHISALQRRGTCANWLLMSQAEELLTVSRKRVYKDYGKRTYAVEVPPKLNAILSVLNEILSKAESDFPDQNRPVLVLVRHKRTVELIKYYLSHGKSKLRDWLVRGRMAYEHPPDLPVEESPPPKKPVASTSHRSTRSHTSRVFSKRVGGRQVISCRGIPDPAGEGFMPSTCDGHPALSGTVEKPSSPKVEASPKAESPDDEDEAVPVPDLPAGCFSFFFTNKEGKRLPIVLRVPPPGSREEGAPSAVDSHNLDGPAGRLAVLLSRLRPQYIVLFEPQVAWVREIEVFSAREFKRRTTEDQTPSPVGIYFMIYKDSVEEQRYLTRLRREKEAFETLISLRSSVVVQKTEPPPPADPSRVEKESTIFVDVREFRSELPALLHRKGVRVNPITLTMGDYILAPHICVERKSVSDLIGSLNSGRLYQQCTAMSRHYLNPVLLIEFSMPANGLTYQRSRFSPTPQGSFALFTGRNAVVSADAQVDLGARNLMSKLVLLIIHFPNLRVLWSVTPYCTAELFTELKLGRSEPTLDQLPHVRLWRHTSFGHNLFFKFTCLLILNK
uniref:DNA repair endonuclease XPF n=1 Tax=Mesocestoides corti TaxID=53468 RepID=A0A5K3FGQ0_MESCO